MEVEEELHYEGEVVCGEDGVEGQTQAAVSLDPEEAENGSEEGRPEEGGPEEGGPPGPTSQGASRDVSPQRTSEGNEEAANCSGSCSSGEGRMEEEEQQQQQQQRSRAGGKPDLYGAGGPGGRRTQHRVLISNLDVSVQWQDLKDFGRKVGEVNYANVIFAGGKKYGVLEYCEEECMNAAIRELDGTRLRSSHVNLKRDRGDFEALISSAPLRWAADGSQRSLRLPPRAHVGPPPRGPPPGHWAQGPLLASPDVRVRERPPPDIPQGPLRDPDYPPRSGGLPPPGVRGARGGAPVVLRPGESMQGTLRGGPSERHHQPFGGSMVPPPRGSRIAAAEDVFMPRRLHSPGRGRAPEAPRGGPRRSRSPSPSWRAPPVHAGYRELIGKEGYAGNRIAIYEAPMTWREGPRESRRDHLRREGVGGLSYANGAAGEGGPEGPSHKHSSFHGNSLREEERASPPPPLPYTRGAAAQTAEALPSSGLSRGGWERGGPRRPPSPRRARPAAAPFGGGGASASRGYGGDGRSRSRSRERRPYGEAKRRRGSPLNNPMVMCVFGAPPPAAPAEGDWRSRASGGEGILTEGRPACTETRRRPRSRSPRGGRDPPYPPPHSHLVPDGRHLADQGGLTGGPAGGPPGAAARRPSRDRREDLLPRSGGGGGGGGGPHHLQEPYTSWGGGPRREENWIDRPPPPPESSQPHFGGAPHRKCESPPMRRRHMGPPEGAPSSETRYVDSFGELRARGDPSPQLLHAGGAPSAHLPRGAAGGGEERRGGGSWGYRPLGGGGAPGAPPPPFKGGAAVSRRDAPPPLMGRNPQGHREAFAQLPYRA